MSIIVDKASLKDIYQGITKLVKEIKDLAH